MSAPQMRPVRVTLEGEGRALPSGLLQVQIGGGTFTYAWPGEGVTVEWLRAWHNGDVVLDADGEAMQRIGGQWRWAGRSGIASSDGDATAWAEQDPSRVLRYQAGEWSDGA